ncbi:universal stress protein [Cellulomonas sp. P22]|uniref:universal stress protein n=1 Tax=Cellulomonas sp. P22 TaxID=3373189 RepID=UPI0037B27BA6
MTAKPVVLVGVDGSAASLHALDWAAAEARLRGHALRIVSAYTLPAGSAASLDGGYAITGAHAVVDEATTRAVEVGGIEVSGTVATGDAAGVLVEMSHEAGLAVVGTRGRGGFANRLLGTVSSGLPAHASCPTVVVPLRGTQRGQQVPADAAVPPVRPVRRIMVGVDGSPQSQNALRRAISEAEEWGAELTAVAGVPMPGSSSTMAWMSAAVDTAKLLEDVAVALDVEVDRALVGHPGVEVKRRVVDGNGAELLIELSSTVDLVVVGSRGRGGFTGLLLGSTSQAVLHHAMCPVMVVTNRCRDEEQ